MQNLNNKLGMDHKEDVDRNYVQNHMIRNNLKNCEMIRCFKLLLLFLVLVFNINLVFIEFTNF